MFGQSNNAQTPPQPGQFQAPPGGSPFQQAPPQPGQFQAFGQNGQIPQGPPKDTNLEKFSKEIARSFAQNILAPLIEKMKEQGIAITMEQALSICELPSVSASPASFGGGFGGAQAGGQGSFTPPGPGECVHKYERGGAKNPAGSYCKNPISQGSQYCAQHVPNK